MRTRTIAIIVIALVIVGFAGYAVLAGNSKDSGKDNSMANMNMSDSSSKPDNSKPSTQAVATDEVEIENFAFTPANITVKVGTKVTWINKDSTAHTVTADNTSNDAPSSEMLGKGQSYSFTFTKAGTYGYHCTVHPSMTGTVTVTE